MTTNNDANNHDLSIVTFMLGDQYYGLRIMDVIEVAAMVELTSLANTRPEILGAANRHGEVLPMLDLRLVMGHDAKLIDNQTMFIVATHDDHQIGLVVDRVLQVEHLPSKKIDLSGVDHYIRGMLTHQDRMIQLVNIRQIYEGFLAESIAQEG